MDHYAFNWFALPPLVAAFCSLAVGVWVLGRERSSKVGEIIFGGALAVTIWLGTFGVMYLAADASTALLWARLAHIAIPFMPALIYSYLTVGLRRYHTDKALVWTALVVAVLFAYSALTTHHVIAGVERHWWGYYPVYGPAGYFLAGYFALVIIAGLAVLFRHLRETPKGSLFYRRLGWSCVQGVAAAVVGIDFLAIFKIPVYPVGYLPTLVFLAAIVVMQVRHRIVYLTPAAAAAQILATMQGAVLVTSPEGDIEVSNRAAAELLGFGEADLLELSLDEIFTSGQCWRSLLTDCLAGNRVRDLETSWKPSEGPPVEVSVSASVLTDAGGQPVGVVFAAVDISSRKKAAEALRDREEQLRQSQKMEAIGRLAGGIAHDFNNLLTAIIGNSELALCTMAPDDPNRPLVDDIHQVGKRAASLTRQILAFSRRQMLRPEVLCLNKLVLDLEPLLRRTLGEDVEIAFSLAPDLKNCEIDPHQFGQVLVNLAVNSRDAMPDGGRLIIETANTTLDEESCLNRRETAAGDYVMLAVSDNGTGMDEETRSHLFEPFFTTKAQGNGTGLGLSTVFGIVKQSGGSISVFSELGMGSTFKLYLPVVHVAASPALETAAEVDTASARLGNILVVEDEIPVRGLVARVLTRAGYQVKTAESAGEVETILASDHYQPDLLLADVVLPGGINGRQVADGLLQRYPELRVVFMSGYATNAVVHEGRVADDIIFLPKPFNSEALLRTVREAMPLTPARG